MKVTYLLSALAAVSATASAFQCPSKSDIDTACQSLNVSPLVCSDPTKNVEECNAAQCNQSYIDNYAICQCRRTTDNFYQSSTNVQGLLNRCGGSFTNLYGDPSIYRPGQGTATFAPTSSDPAPTSPPSQDVNTGTRVVDGTTYAGGVVTAVDGTAHVVGATAAVGETSLVGGTTTWSDNTPGIVGATSVAPNTEVVSPSPNPSPNPATISLFQGHPFEITDHHVSGGAIAGIVLGLLGCLVLSIGVGYCWRKRLEKEGDYDYGQPSRHTVVEKVEPVVVRQVPN